MRFVVGDFQLHVTRRTITGPDGDVHVEPQVFEVLVYLASNRDRVVPKTELLDEIWGDQFVSESALTSRIKSGRAALGDNGRDQRVIATSHGFGYRWVADVVVDGAAEAGRFESSTSLPRFRTRLRGRDDDLAEVEDLLSAHQLVTLLGPGGTGKTRLAVEVLGRLAGDDRPQVFVDLASTREAASVAATVAAALSIDTGQRADALTAVCEYLDAEPHLVIIDNCEHVLDAAAATVATVTTRATATRIVATSREPLGVPGERLYRLGPLPVLPADRVHDIDDLETNPATALFLDRARLAGATLDVSAREAALVAGLCRELDGLPLAIELAAGRMSAFDIDDLVDLLDRRLDLLGDRSSTRDDRHRTLRATVGWSYDLLSEPEQRLFRSLSMLPGGVTLDGIEWMAARFGLGIAGIDAAGRLVDASLLTRRRTPAGSRYSMLETLRAFGIDRLVEHGESETVGDLATEYTLEVLDQIERGLDTDDEPAFADRMQRELPNVRAARSRLIEQERLVDLVELCRRLARWSRMRSASEVWSWYDDLVGRIPDDQPEWPTALALYAQAAWRSGDIATAQAATAASLAAPCDDSTRCLALWERGAALLFAGAMDDARRAWIDLSAIRDDGTAPASAAVAAAYAGDIDTARTLIAEGRRSTTMPATTASWLDYCEAEAENTIGAADPAMLERSIERAQALDCSFIVGVATVTLATLLEQLGDVSGAARRYRDLISHWLRSGSWTQQWTTLRHVAELIEESSPETALLVLRSAAADSTSAPALVGPRAAVLETLERRLERRIGNGDVPTVTRVEVAERARSALAALAEPVDTGA